MKQIDESKALLAVELEQTRKQLLELKTAKVEKAPSAAGKDISTPVAAASAVAVDEAVAASADSDSENLAKDASKKSKTKKSEPKKTVSSSLLELKSSKLSINKHPPLSQKKTAVDISELPNMPATEVIPEALRPDILLTMFPSSLRLFSDPHVNKASGGGAVSSTGNRAG